MTPDNDLTILLALKDRGPFTFRWMSYSDSIRFPFHVFIADGGSDDSVAKVLSNHSTFPNVGYEYRRYPYDKTYRDYNAKLADALSRIRTPFVALADDDDFFFVNGLREATAFLAEHQDYATCGGQCAIFWVTPPQTNEGGDGTYGSDVEWKCSANVRSLDDDTAEARIQNQPLRATHPAYYHVRRTDELRQQLDIVCESDLKDLFLIERLLFVLTAIAGKSKQLDTLYLARQWNSPGSSGGAHQAQYGDWLGRMLVPSWSKDFTHFVNVTSTALAARESMTMDEARRSIIKSYRMWLAPQLLGDLLGEPTVTMPMSIVVRGVRRLLDLSPDHIVRRMARMIYRRTRWISVDALHGTQLRTRHVSNAVQEFKPIREFLARGL